MAPSPVMNTVSRIGRNPISRWIAQEVRRSGLTRPDRALARASLPWFDRAGVAFIHVPKAAGTSIAHAIYGHSIAHVTAAAARRYAPERWEALPSFAVVRNPWDRALSAYRFARGGGGVGQGAVRITAPELYAGPAFSSFARFVEGWLAERDLDVLDHVFRPQWRYLCDDEGRAQVNHIGRFEDMQAVERHAGEVLRRPVSFGRANITSDAGGYRDAYTPELRRRIGLIYERDIDLFGYRF